MTKQPTKLDIIDYSLLGVLVILVVGYAFGFVASTATTEVIEWVGLLLLAFGFKKAPQTIGK